MGVVIRRWVWLESIGVVSGCFPHITYISLLHTVIADLGTLGPYSNGRFRNSGQNINIIIGIAWNHGFLHLLYECLDGLYIMENKLFQSRPHSISQFIRA